MSNRRYELSERTYAKELLAGLEEISRRTDLNDKERDFLSRALPPALRRMQKATTRLTHPCETPTPSEVICSQSTREVLIDHELSEWCACDDCTLWRLIAPRCAEPDWRPEEQAA